MFCYRQENIFRVRLIGIFLIGKDDGVEVMLQLEDR